MIYLDTSAIAPLYWTEALSNAIEALLNNVEVEPAMSSLVEVELISALSRRVRTGEISQEQAELIRQEFQADLNAGFYTQLLGDRPFDYCSGAFNQCLETRITAYVADVGRPLR